MTGKNGAGALGALLREYRLAVNLTQEELAERSGLTAEAIGMLERGDRRSPRPRTVELLATALELGARQRDALIAAAQGRPVPAASQDAPLDPAAAAAARLAAAQTLLRSMPVDALPARTPLPDGSRMPLAPNPLFVGRGEELLQVAAALAGGDTTVALGPVVASTGMGGLGKTQLAVEFVHRYARYFTGGVFWLSFASADEIPLQVAACAPPEFENRSLAERLKLVTAAWGSAVPRLLVFDNCEDEALLDTWRPTTGGCRVLVTSRRSRWSPTLGVTALPLDLLPRLDSIELLHRYRPDLGPGDPRLDAIAGRLGDLPLALHLAGRYLIAYHAEVGLDGYLAELDQPSVMRHASLLGEGLDDSPSPTHHVQSLAQTFALCLSRLDREREADQVAIAVLARMGCMAPGEPVPRDLLAKTLEDVDPLRRADGLRRLGAVGLLVDGDGWLRLHRLLVHFVRQERLDPGAERAVALALIACGDEADRGQLAGPGLGAVVPHLVEVAGRACVGANDERVAAELCSATGTALRAAADLTSARPWYERALAIRERVLGPDHPDTADSLNSLGILSRTQGELGAARALYLRALAIREQVLGPHHPDTGESLNNLGVLLLEQGELAAARAVHQRALAIWERALGPDHHKTLASLNNLAAVLRDQGELAAARVLFERALAAHERVMGPDRPHVAFMLNGLARLLQAEGELDAARRLYERALAIRERVLEPGHPLTAVSLNDLALLHRARGDPAAARPLFERALAIRERVLGPDHPDTVATARALAER